MSSLPSYLAAAKPVPAANRAPWYKTVMPTYIGIMLWFVFWQVIVNAGVNEHGRPAGVLSHGYWPAFLGLTIAAVDLPLPLLPGARLCSECEPACRFTSSAPRPTGQAAGDTCRGF